MLQCSKCCPWLTPSPSIDTCDIRLQKLIVCPNKTVPSQDNGCKLYVTRKDIRVSEFIIKYDLARVVSTYSQVQSTAPAVPIILKYFSRCTFRLSWSTLRSHTFFHPSVLFPFPLFSLRAKLDLDQRLLVQNLHMRTSFGAPVWDAKNDFVTILALFQHMRRLRKWWNIWVANWDTIPLHPSMHRSSSICKVGRNPFWCEKGEVYVIWKGLVAGRKLYLRLANVEIFEMETLVELTGRSATS